MRWRSNHIFVEPAPAMYVIKKVVELLKISGIDKPH